MVRICSTSDYQRHNQSSSHRLHQDIEGRVEDCSDRTEIQGKVWHGYHGRKRNGRSICSLAGIISSTSNSGESQLTKRSEVINIIGTHVMCIPILTFFNRNQSVGVRRAECDRCCAAHRVVMICSILCGLASDHSHYNQAHTKTSCFSRLSAILVKQ